MNKKDSKNKVALIRELLVKSLEKNSDLFEYYASILEAKELLSIPDILKIKLKNTSHRKIQNRLIAEI